MQKQKILTVKIDPTFIIASGSALDDIYSVYTMEAAPNDTTLGRQYLYVGAQPYSTSNDGRYRLFMHFNAYSNVNSQMMGLPTAVTDANGTVVTSSYDENYRITETGIENIADISYTYSNGNLASIARTDDSDST